MSEASVRTSRAAVPRGALLEPSATPTGARLELVEIEMQRRRRRSMLVCALLGALLIGGPFVVVSMHVRMAQQQYQLDKLNTKIESAQRVNRFEAAKVANMASPDWIVPQAQRLGLVQPESVNVITIDESNSNVGADSSNNARSANSQHKGDLGKDAGGPNP